MPGRLVRTASLIGWIGAQALVATLSLQPEPEMPMPFDEADKLYHMAAYSLLAFLPFFAFERRGAVIAAAAMVLFGAAIEFGQSFVPGRSPSFLDILANSAGVLAGMGLAIAVSTLRDRRGGRGRG